MEEGALWPATGSKIHSEAESRSAGASAASLYHRKQLTQLSVRRNLLVRVTKIQTEIDTDTARTTEIENLVMPQHSFISFKTGSVQS